MAVVVLSTTIAIPQHEFNFNQGHSTTTVNNARFMVDGYAPILELKAGKKPEVTIDLSKVYGKNLNSLHRKFIKESNTSILIQDQIQINETTKNITWGLMTTAEVLPVDGGAILKQGGKELRLSILNPHKLNVSVISLDPPPLKIDKTIEDLKRIKIRIPSYIFKNNEGLISVRLSGEKL